MSQQMKKPNQKQQQLRKPEIIQKSNKKAGVQFKSRGFADYEQSPGFEPWIHSKTENQAEIIEQKNKLKKTDSQKPETVNYQ